MKKKYWPWMAVGAIFLVTLGIRLYFAFMTPNFSDDDAYFVLRQVDHIRQTGFPLFRDTLSYGGRTYVFLPLFHYILAFFSLFMGTVNAAKIIPNVFATSLVFIVFLIVRHLTKDDRIAILSAFISGFLPIYISETINSATVLSMIIPMTFLLFYFMLRIRSKKYIYYYLIALSVFILLSPYSILFILAILLYYLFSWVEGFKPTRTEIEITVFSLFLAIWFYSIFYRDALLMHGFSVIWQNIPSEVINQFYSGVNILDAIYQIGLIPLLAGIYITYHYIYKTKRKPFYLTLSLMIIILALLLLRYIQLKLGLVFIGVILTILFGEFLLYASEYLGRTKFARYRNHLFVLLLVVFILTSFIPSLEYADRKITESDPGGKVFALQFLQNISNPDEAVVGSVFDGHLITYLAKRKNIIDSNFLLVDATERLQDVRTIYTSAIQSTPIDLMDKYHAGYIVLTDEAKKYYNITRISYVDDSCFPMIFSSKDVIVYQKKC